MTAADALRNLFEQPPPPGADLVWFADQVVGIAQHQGSLELPAPPLDDSSVLFRRLFRPLLARLAVLSADETGTDFDPYHGHYTLTRSSREGPVRLDISIANTSGEQRLRIIRTPAPSPGRAGIAGPPVADPGPSQTAG